MAAAPGSDDLLAVGCALVAAFAFPIGSAMQQRANLVQMRVGARSASEAARGVVRQPMWWGGQVVAAAGSGFQIVAVGVGALALVNPVLLSQLVWMVPAGAWVIGSRMRGREWGGAILAMAGLAALLVALQPEEGADSGPASAWLVVFVVFGLAAVACWVMARLPAAVEYRAALLGALVGIETGVMGAVMKQAVNDISWDNWTVWIAPVLGFGAVPLINLSLRAGRLSTAQTLAAVCSSAAGFVIGPWVYGEKITLAVGNLAVAVMSLVVLAAGLVVLARSPSLLALDRAASRPPG